jgi:hypothetical protein
MTIEINAVAVVVFGGLSDDAIACGTLTTQGW